MKKKSNIKKLSAHTCEWCGIEQAVDKFFKCSTKICSKCIKAKYNEICSKHGKLLAMVICCHYLDIAFNPDIYNSLQENQNIGHYIRHLNLLQNQNPDTFEKGLIDNNIICCGNDNNSHIEKMKNKLDNFIEELEIFKNDI